MRSLLSACLLAGCSPHAPEIGGDTAPAATDTLPATDTNVEQIDASGCDPGAAAVYGTEGRALGFTVTCQGEGSATSFEVADLPAGATFDAATFAWTPGLSDAGHYTFIIRSVGEQSDAGVVDVLVADGWDVPGNAPVDVATYAEEYGLPVFHLERPPRTNESSDVATTLVYKGRPYAIGLKYRGASSLYYPKNSYTLSFSSEDEFQDEDEGFDKRRKLVLTTLFDDNSYVRQWLCYRLWSELDPERHQVQVFLASVYINGAYEGLYLVSDHIDGEYWEDWGYSEEGSLYKSVSHEANFYDTYGGAPKSSWHAGYEKQEGVAGVYTDLDALVAFVATSTDEEFAAGIESYVAIDEIADWWILVRFTEADDSGGKNAYLYIDPSTGLAHHVPWDFNHSFGQTWQTEREASNTNYDFFWSNYLFLRLLADPVFGPRLEARLHAALDGPLSSTHVVTEIESLLERAGPSAERDWEKWSDAYRAYGGWSWRTDWTDHAAEVAYVKQWTREREDYMRAWYP